MTKRISHISLAAATFLIAFAGVSFAADATGVTATDQTSALDFLKDVYSAFAGGNRVYAGALALFASLVLLKRYAWMGLSNWLKTDVGGALMTLGLSFTGALVAALVPGTGATLSLSLLWTTGGIAVGAAGGYTLIKKLLIVPIVEPLIPKMPSFLQGIARLVVSFFDGNGEALIEAKKAGDAAVAANPAPGVAAVVGAPTDIK